MKAYVFIETGELREPKDGEWFLNIGGQPVRCNRDYGTKVIVTRHEIDIPDRATLLKIVPVKEEPCDINQVFNAIDVPAPRVKKKVKKWRWVVRNSATENWFLTSSHYSEYEVKCKHLNCDIFKVIYETEVEG